MTPLQFGELADHARYQVGFRQRGATGRFGGVGADQGGDRLRQGGQPANAVALGAQFGVECHLVQCGDAGFQPGLAIQVPEMAGIGKAGAENAFVAGDDDGAIVVGLDIGDEARTTELRRRPPVRRRNTAD